MPYKFQRWHPNRVQYVCKQALAMPERRQELADSLSNEEYAQLETFFEGMEPAEVTAIQKALRS